MEEEVSNVSYLNTGITGQVLFKASGPQLDLAMLVVFISFLLGWFFFILVT